MNRPPLMRITLSFQNPIKLTGQRFEHYQLQTAVLFYSQINFQNTVGSVAICSTE